MIVAGFLVFGVVVALAAFFVIREAGRIAKEPPPALFDPDDAYDWVVEHLPDDVAATLTPDDVRRILEFQVEFFERTNAPPNGSLADDDESVVVGSGDEISYILERSAATGRAYLPEQIDGVVEAQLGYLRFIGAVGPTTEPGDSSPPTSAI